MKGTTMVPDVQNTRSTAQRRPGANLEDLVAELTEAAYPIALRHHAGTKWLDLEMELWQALAQTVRKWQQHALRPLSQ
jgi:hypothetical protein